MDTGIAVRYNGWVVWQEREQIDAREKFSRESIAYLDHLYRVAFYLAKDDSEARDLVQDPGPHRPSRTQGWKAQGSNPNAGVSYQVL